MEIENMVVLGETREGFLTGRVYRVSREEAEKLRETGKYQSFDTMAAYRDELREQQRLTSMMH